AVFSIISATGAAGAFCSFDIFFSFRDSLLVVNGFTGLETGGSRTTIEPSLFFFFISLPSSLRTFYFRSQSFVKSAGPVSLLNSRAYEQKNSTLKNPRIRREHHTYVPTSPDLWKPRGFNPVFIIVSSVSFNPVLFH